MPAPFSKAGSAKSTSKTSATNCAATPGLSSYPHPWLMPDFWQFPTVSMGLGPIKAIYQARFMRYLEDRGIIPATPRKVWAFLGDGETDEPESLGSLTLASREKLDNLIFVINCNLQRLDGPVRGNGKIIQELEAAFRGAGWNVIKVIWGGDWDTLFARDKNGLLVKRMGEVVDGEYQNYKAKGGAYIRREFFGKYPELLELVADMTDDELHRLQPRRPRSGEGLRRLQARRRAQGRPDRHPGQHDQGLRPGLGEGRNVTHQQKKLNEQALIAFPHALRHSDSRRRRARRLALSSARRQPGDRVHARSAARRWAASCPSAVACQRTIAGAAARSTSTNRWPARRAAASRPPWPSSACCGSC